MTQCEFCGKEFNSTYLKTHQEAVHKLADPNTLLTCEFCGKQYHKFQKKHYLSHLQVKHFMDKEFICTEPLCGRTFLHQRGLLRHVRSFHQQTVPCGLCPEGFASLWKRDKHRAEEHGQYDFVCEECGLKFFRRAELEIHTRRVHTLQLRYQCSACSHRSEERRKLLNHEHAAHGLHVAPLPAHNPAGQLGYPCPACRAVYGCGLAVKQHAWEQHQIKLNIYGRPKNPANKLDLAAAAATADAIAQIT
ncbi:zinc finger and SCAN domain-containing protein 25-like [Pollicipes pollicipes]|uniref:zinc finger and SCAN domain-containing protein 25-like n=1 Tax=Pollicipes pollicipes TaxID=41117 RepID=UPI0018850185|nr:zinc finger and SCAN domain-containing protein 25-like [Pollicipes pollicipes]